jgi:hypothetical protein
MAFIEGKTLTTDGTERTIPFGAAFSQAIGRI